MSTHTTMRDGRERHRMSEYTVKPLTSSTWDDFARLVHDTEHRLLVDTLADLCNNERTPTEVSA